MTISFLNHQPQQPQIRTNFDTQISVYIFTRDIPRFVGLLPLLPLLLLDLWPNAMGVDSTVSLSD